MPLREIHMSEHDVIRTSNERPPLDTPWTRLEEYVRTWLMDAEVIGEDKNGMEGAVALTDRDDWMRNDAVQGLIADDKFVDMLIEARMHSRAENRAAGSCEICGNPNGEHWGDGERCRKAIAVLTHTHETAPATSSPMSQSEALEHLAEARGYIECDPIAEERGVIERFDAAVAALSTAPETRACVYESESGDTLTYETGCGNVFRLDPVLELYEFCPYCGKPVSVCSTCNGTREVDETLGGYATSNPHAPCPDCTRPRPALKANALQPIPVAEEDISHWWKCLNCHARNDPATYPVSCPCCATLRPPSSEGDPR